MRPNFTWLNGQKNVCSPIDEGGLGIQNMRPNFTWLNGQKYALPLMKVG
jgi:hypothetical protein